MVCVDLNLLRESYPKSKRVGGGGTRPLLENGQKKATFLWGTLPLVCPTKGKLLFSSVELVKLSIDPDFVVLVKFSIFWLHRVLRVYLDMYAPDFPKNTSKYLFCTEVVRKHGFRCFTAMCTFGMHFLVKELF